MSDSTSRLGRYSLRGKLGAGGMGEVHLAHDSKLGRDVALKILPEAQADDRELRARLLREARAAAALNHPNIATIHDVGEVEGRDYVAFERIEGRTLAAELAGRELAPDELLQLVLALADAIAYAHERGVIHRDIKPGNVMLTARGEPKLLDFGLAKVESLGDGEVPEGLTIQGAIIGSPSAMSPEQAQGLPVDARSDVFSFGSLMYEMAARRPAFTGKTIIDVVASVVRDEPEPLERLRKDLPYGYARVAARALEKDPDRRYPTMRELIEDLRAGPDAGASSGKRPRATLVGAIVLLVAAGTFFAWKQSGGRARSVDAGSFAGARIGVIGFENVGDPADAKNLVRMLVPLITTDLAESGGLEVLSTARVRESVRQVLGPGAGYDPASAREVARVAGAEVMLVGDLTESGPSLSVFGELVEVSSGRSLGSARARADTTEDLFALAATLAGSVRQQLGLAPPSGATPFDPAAALTSSTSAWNRFVAGRIALHLAEYDQAIQHFQAAIHEDETFALAYYYLSIAHDWDGSLEGNDAILEEGLPHVARLPARWRAVYDAALDWAREDWDAAYDKLVDIVDRDDVLPEALNVMGEVIEHDPDYWNPELARSMFERALEIDPTFEVVLFHLVDTLLLMEDHAAVAELVHALRARDPESPRALASEVMAAIWRADWDAVAPLAEEGWRRKIFSAWWFYTKALRATDRVEETWAVYDQAFEEEHGFLKHWVVASRSLTLMERGRFDEAVDEIARVVEEFTDPGHDRLTRSHSSFAAQHALLLGLIGRNADAVVAARRGVEFVPDEPAGYYWLAYMLHEDGRGSEVQDVALALAGLRAHSRNVTLAFWEEMITAESALRTGDLEACEEALGRVDEIPTPHRDESVEAWLRGRLGEAAGDSRAAADAFARVVPTYRWYIESHTLIARLARFRRACSLQDLDDPSFDREVLEEVVEAWGESELALAEEARARLAR